MSTNEYQDLSGGREPITQRLYNRLLRPRLPEQLATVGDITIRRGRALDATDRFDSYEQELRETIPETVRPGDGVLIVGGGFGVSTVVAARAAGPSGRIRVIEPVADNIRRIREAVDRNHAPAAVTVDHAAIGEVVQESVDRFGAADGDQLTPADVDLDVDVLVMDAEGAERYLLPEREADLPSRMVIETHDFDGSDWRTDHSTIPGRYAAEFVGGTAADQVWHCVDQSSGEAAAKQQAATDGGQDG